MARQIGYVLFDHYYQGLIHCLPMRNDLFLSQLQQYCLLSSDVSAALESLTTSAERASYFLDNGIKPSLKENNDSYFIKLLTVMKQSKHCNVVELAEKILKEFNTASSTNLIHGKLIL